MDDGEAGALIVIALIIGLIVGSVTTLNAVLDTKGTVTKVVNLDEDTDIVVIENSYGSIEVLAAPANMMHEGAKYKNIELNINYRIDGIEVESK